ncbi:hypothetical protein [Bradyrhizobium sp. CCBAU 25338]|uniref:hypothetical protein n=1 Tax=Bradyrhizobium sp. CCBAU 25338 TaxID=1641877 RepID=UPI002303E3AF|nr:hypothetical protein [Bradyrhizobium sp. CCBAU 25338]MDA9529795.1 hypothetical protein [Bradyrhizobium sp. CCBAU 25338]
MRRFSVLAACLAALTAPAHAQFNVFRDSAAQDRANGRPINRDPANAKSAWERLAGPVLSCTDSSLQRERTSVRDLVQRNIYPNDPYYSRIIAKCEQDLRPRASDSSEPVRSPEWKTYPIEKRFAYFLETFWVDRRLSSANCTELAVRGKSYFDRKACILSKGFWFETSSPQHCKMVVRERTPLFAEPEKAWDGKVVGKAIVGREVAFDLATLDEALIRKAAAGLDIYFEIDDPSSVVRRLAFSDNPDKWIDVPPPPLASTLKLSGSDDERYNALLNARAAWAADANRYETEIPGYQIAGFANPKDTNSDEGLRLLHDNRMRTFLLLSTSSHYGHAMQPRQQDTNTLMNAEFIETVKLVLSQCKK